MEETGEEKREIIIRREEITRERLFSLGKCRERGGENIREKGKNRGKGNDVVSSLGWA